MKAVIGSALILMLAGAALGQPQPKVQTQAPAEAVGDARDCAGERKRIAALTELNVSYREKISLLEQRIKALEKRP
jgi:hypothetical protein